MIGRNLHRWKAHFPSPLPQALRLQQRPSNGCAAVHGEHRPALLALRIAAARSPKQLHRASGFYPALAGPPVWFRFWLVSITRIALPNSTNLFGKLMVVQMRKNGKREVAALGYVGITCAWCAALMTARHICAVSRRRLRESSVGRCRPEPAPRRADLARHRATPGDTPGCRHFAARGRAGGSGDVHAPRRAAPRPGRAR